MQEQYNQTTIDTEGIYIPASSIVDGSVYVTDNYGQYPEFSNITISADGTLAFVGEHDGLQAPEVFVHASDWVVDKVEAVRSTFIELNNNEIARHSFKQRLKFLLAMVGLVGVAVIFALVQLSKGVILPPLPADAGTASEVAAADPAPALQNSIAIAANSASISPVFSPEVQKWEAQIIQWAGEFGVDPNAVATIMQIESCGDPLAESYVGAQGLFQVMPFHFEADEVMKDPATNARRGIAYYKLGLEISGDIGLALAGYNGGHSIASKSQDQWAHETQRYFYWGTGILADATAGKQSSPRLQEWMQAGGASLCAQAASRVFPVASQ